MTQAEFLTAHAVLEQRATHALADTCALFGRTAWRAEFVAALQRARQPLPARRARSARPGSTGCWAATM